MLSKRELNINTLFKDVCYALVNHSQRRMRPTRNRRNTDPNYGSMSAEPQQILIYGWEEEAVFPCEIRGNVLGRCYVAG